MFAKVLTVSGNKAVIQFANEEEATVALFDLSLVDPRTLSEDHPAQELVRPAEQSSLDSSKSRPSKKLKKSSLSPPESPVSNRSSWIVPHIVVRIISKSFRQAKYYNKRVKVIDVISKGECIVQLDDGKILEGVTEKMIETALPKPGGNILVLAGPLKGQKGILLKRDQDREEATVQIYPDLNVEVIKMDDIAEYCEDIENV